MVSNLVSKNKSYSGAVFYTVTKMKISIILGLIAFASIAYAEQETLVLVDNLNIRETHSQFFKSLQGK